MLKEGVRLDRVRGGRQKYRRLTPYTTAADPSASTNNNNTSNNNMNGSVSKKPSLEGEWHHSISLPCGSRRSFRKQTTKSCGRWVNANRKCWRPLKFRGRKVIIPQLTWTLLYASCALWANCTTESWWQPSAGPSRFQVRPLKHPATLPMSWNLTFEQVSWSCRSMIKCGCYRRAGRKCWRCRWLSVRSQWAAAAQSCSGRPISVWARKKLAIAAWTNYFTK